MTVRIVLAVRSSSRLIAVVSEGFKFRTDGLGDCLELLLPICLYVLSFLLVFDDFLLYLCPRKLFDLPSSSFIFCIFLHKFLQHRDIMADILPLQLVGVVAFEYELLSALFDV